MRYLKGIYFAATLLLVSVPVLHAEPMKEDAVHVQTWNRFTDDVYALHLKQIKGRDIIENSKICGYPGDKDFYIEVEYVDKKTKRLLSRICWEKANPDRIHVIEVYVYDRKGRVIRDYTSAYLPHFRNAPTQTLIALHQYTGKLHAIRIFDASAEIVTEKCTGRYKGKDVFILMDIDDILAARDNRNGLMQTSEYHRCFDGMESDVTPYLRAENDQP